MPLTIGGGIRSIQDIRELLLVGADKVVINTAAYTNPELIREASKSFGSQCIVVGIDVREEDEGYEVYSHSGTVKQGVSLEEHLQFMGLAGAGEFFINNISRDGLMQGYDTALIATVQAITNVPVIACGGAGNFMHLVNCFKETSVSALAMSSIFHFGDNNPIRARAHLLNHKIQIKNV
jgi:cyclase